MADYIDRQVTIDYIEENKRRLGITNCNASNFKDILRMQLAAPVREYTPGTWVKSPFGVCCSNCRVEGSPGWVCCPVCGAWMGGGEQ